MYKINRLANMLVTVILLTGCNTAVNDPETAAPPAQPSAVVEEEPRSTEQAAESPSPIKDNMEDVVGNEPAMKEGQKAVAVDEVAFDGSAVELAAEFQADKSAFNKKYMGKTLVVEGPFGEAGIDHEGHYFLALNGNTSDSYRPFVFAVLDKEARGDILNSLEGRVMKIKGIVTTHPAFFGATLKNCEVLELGPQKVEIVAKTVGEIYDEFKNNRRDAESKYETTGVRVTGVVVEVKGSDIVLRDADTNSPARLVATFSVSYINQYKSMKAGDTVTLLSSGNGFYYANMVELDSYSDLGDVIVIPFPHLWHEDSTAP